MNHYNSFIIDQNYNLFNESSLIETSKDVFSVFSRTTPNEQVFLYKTARDSSLSGNIVEIGRFTGGSTCIMALGIKDANKKEKVHSYDLNLIDITLENIKRLGLESYIEINTQSSEEGAKQWKNNGCPPCRFLLIDGDHEYQATVDDIAMWVPHLMPGGIIAIHDYGNTDSRHFDVERAVHDEIIQKNKFENYQVLDFMFTATKRFNRG
ncbi:MAG: class I SAM-dependent methyltransferase [Nitrospinae bacterium]|nr:class I SAM-dependent methyltransferase [Nitrospinota bacterium]